MSRNCYTVAAVAESVAAMLMVVIYAACCRCPYLRACAFSQMLGCLSCCQTQAALQDRLTSA